MVQSEKCDKCEKSLCRFENCKFLHTGNCRYCHPEYHDEEYIPLILENIDDWIENSIKARDHREISMGYDAKIDWFIKYQTNEFKTIIQLFEQMIATDVEVANTRGEALGLQKYWNWARNHDLVSADQKNILWRIYETEGRRKNKKNQAMALHHLRKYILVDGENSEDEILNYLSLSSSIESEINNENYVEYVGSLLSFLFNCTFDGSDQLDSIVEFAISKIADEFIRDLYMTCFSSRKIDRTEHFGRGIYSLSLATEYSEILFQENISLLMISPHAEPNIPISNNPLLVIDLANVLNLLSRKYHRISNPFEKFIDFLDGEVDEKTIYLVATHGIICEYPNSINQLLFDSRVNIVIPMLRNNLSQDLSFVAIARSSLDSIIVTDDRLRSEQEIYPEWVEENIVKSLRRFKVTKKGFMLR
jgi:hypothetical protein